MAKYKQSYSSRMDESLGMRRGAERNMKQSYKDRRDESYGAKSMGGVMGHEKMPKSCDSFAAQRSDLNRLKMEPNTNRGYPQQAWGYKY